MRQLELQFEKGKPFRLRSAGRIRYKNFSIHEKINYKSYFINYANTLSAARNHFMLMLDIESTINETQIPFA